MSQVSQQFLQVFTEFCVTLLHRSCTQKRRLYCKSDLVCSNKYIHSNNCLHRNFEKPNLDLYMPYFFTQIVQNFSWSFYSSRVCPALLIFEPAVASKVHWLLDYTDYISHKMYEYTRQLLSLYSVFVIQAQHAITSYSKSDLISYKMISNRLLIDYVKLKNAASLKQYK